LRIVTDDISSGGLYFELPLFEGISAPQVSSMMNIELTIPPGDGYFPYEGRVNSVAEVMRCESLSGPGGSDTDMPGRMGIALKFQRPLKLTF